MEFILIVTKPQAVIWPFTRDQVVNSIGANVKEGNKTASGNLAFHYNKHHLHTYP